MINRIPLNGIVMALASAFAFVAASSPFFG